MDLFSALFEPKCIALIGASSDEKRTTSRPQRFLAKHGFTGEILPVNPGRAEIFGLKAYKDIDSVPGEIDHAYILLNGKDAVAALAACGRHGVKVASILAGGFADAGAAGASLQDELLRIVKETGIRLVGPNSIGTVSTDPPMALTANAAFAIDELRAGNWGLVSQSGSLIGALLSRADARGVGFSRLISVGNEVDLAVGELADLLVDDAKTRAILLFMETLRDGERLARAARRAHAVAKPVIAYKLGRSEIGQELAKSHTGAIAGSDATFDAFCRRHGIVRVSMFESLVDVPALLVDRPPVKGKRVAVATMLKVLSADIAHKTEAGGVALGLADGQAAALAAREIEKRVRAHAPTARLDGFLIQKMERGLAEVIVGFRRDPLVGPTVTVGLGGVLAEIYKDAATRLAPVDEAEARRMIDEVKGLATVRGYRNLPKGDVAALARAVAALSRLAHEAFAEVAEAEINPLLVKRDGEGVVAVDGLVLLMTKIGG